VKHTTKILIVNDHSITIEGYKSILACNERLDISISTARDCEAAYLKITHPRAAFDVIILDIILPPFELVNLFSGEDIGMLIKKHLPESKIIILTSDSGGFKLYNLIKDIDPEGLLVKSDFTPKEFLEAFENVANGETYYSMTVRQNLKMMQIKEVYLDTCNRRIISLLAKGIKTKNLPTHLNLSISAIDKRKAQIKEMFNIEKGTDEDILRESKKHGFI